MKTHRILIRWGMFLALAMAGCARPLEFVNVQGSIAYQTGVKDKVTLAEAIPGATVRFIPETGAMSKPAQGLTDLNGKFTLETPSHGRGALVGKYRVVISVPPSYPKPVPTCYSDPEQTPFSVEVPPEGVKFLRLLVKNE